MTQQLDKKVWWWWAQKLSSDPIRKLIYHASGPNHHNCRKGGRIGVYRNYTLKSQGSVPALNSSRQLSGSQEQRRTLMACSWSIRAPGMALSRSSWQLRLTSNLRLVKTNLVEFENLEVNISKGDSKAGLVHLATQLRKNRYVGKSRLQKIYTSLERFTRLRTRAWLDIAFAVFCLRLLKWLSIMRLLLQ